MKKLLSITLVFLLLLSTIACTSGCTANISHEKLRFNGRTYIADGGTKYEFFYDVEKDADIWKRITISSGAYDSGKEYYGDDPSNPNFIVTNTNSIYIREDITPDQNTELVVAGTQASFVFTVSQATTGARLDSSAVYDTPFQSVFNFYVSLKQYPYIRMMYIVYKGNGELYLRNYMHDDYYVITDDFRTYLRRIFRDYLGLRSL